MDWQNADGHLRKYGPIFQFFFVFLIVVLDILFPRLIIVTWQLVSLVIILIVVPYIPLIKKIRYGDWEAELESLLVRAERSIEEPDLTKPSPTKGEDEESEKIEEDEELEVSKNEGQESDASGEAEDDEEEISTLRKMANADSRFYKFKQQTENYLEQDPIVALSNLRMELDRTLAAVAEQNGLTYREAIGVTQYELIQNDILPEEDIDDLKQIYNIADKAIHGEEVNQEMAERIIELGERVLKRLYMQIDADISTDPNEPPIEVEAEIE